MADSIPASPRRSTERGEGPGPATAAPLHRDPRASTPNRALTAPGHRITESQNSRGWKGPLWVISVGSRDAGLQERLPWRAHRLGPKYGR